MTSEETQAGHRTAPADITLSSLTDKPLYERRKV